uniref:Uncharacterized protein n=1 Tax=Plectus sambesii TaxID=2011161 RepID=A0A914XS60_9BILA
MKHILSLAIVCLVNLLVVQPPIKACVPTIPSDDLTTTTTVTACTNAAVNLLTPVPIVGNTKFVVPTAGPIPVGGSQTIQCVPDTNPLILFTTIVIVYNLLVIIPPIPPFPPGATQNSRNLPNGEQITLTCGSDGNYFVEACTGIGPLCIPTNGYIGQNLLRIGQIVCQSFP